MVAGDELVCFFRQKEGGMIRVVVRRMNMAVDGRCYMQERMDLDTDIRREGKALSHRRDEQVTMGGRRSR